MVRLLEETENEHSAGIHVMELLQHCEEFKVLVTASVESSYFLFGLGNTHYIVKSSYAVVKTSS